MKAWLYKIGAGFVGILIAALMWSRIALERAKADRDHHKANAEALDATIKLQSKVRQATHEARTEATQEAKRQADHRNAGSRPDTFGDSRLRD